MPDPRSPITPARAERTVLSADRKPLGMLDISDAMKALFEQEEFEERQLTHYIAGIGYQ